MQVIHAVYATPEEIKAMKEAGATISVAPTSELRIGFGLPPVSAFLDAEIRSGCRSTPSSWSAMPTCSPS